MDLHGWHVCKTSNGTSKRRHWSVIGPIETRRSVSLRRNVSFHYLFGSMFREVKRGPKKGDRGYGRSGGCWKRSRRVGQAGRAVQSTRWTLVLLLRRSCTLLQSQGPAPPFLLLVRARPGLNADPRANIGADRYSRVARWPLVLAGQRGVHVHLTTPVYPKVPVSAAVGLRDGSGFVGVARGRQRPCDWRRRRGREVAFEYRAVTKIRNEQEILSSATRAGSETSPCHLGVSLGCVALRCLSLSLEP